MSIYISDAKTIDQLQELGKLSGSEKFIVSNGTETKKVSLNTIAGYTAGMVNGTQKTPGSVGLYNQSVIFVPEGEEIPIIERTPGCFYLEETKQVSIRTKINVPTSVKVSQNLGLKRV